MGLHCVAMPRSGTTLFASESFVSALSLSTLNTHYLRPAAATGLEPDKIWSIPLTLDNV